MMWDFAEDGEDSCERREPWELSAEAFIGPAMVSESFAIDGRQDEDYEILWDMAEDPACLRPPVWNRDGYSVHELEDYEPAGTFVLVAPDRQPCGFYTDAQCWIDPEHRGKGLSTPLILAAAEFQGGSPTDNRGGIGFSEAGYKAHLAAHKAAVTVANEAGKPVPEDVLAEYGLEPPATGYKR